jgi:hypothetical protein
MKSACVLALAGVAVVALASSPALAQLPPPHGRYLNPGTYNLPAPVEFNADVVCGALGVVGQVRFTYDTYGDPTNGGGGALAGGFFLDTTRFAVAPGHALAWGQQIITNVPGAGGTTWGIGAANNMPYPDTQNRNSPRYPFETLDPGMQQPTPAPTLAFRDFPSRSVPPNPVNWLAELALLCIENEGAPAGQLHTAHVIGSLLWGFSMSGTPATLNPNGPHGWGAPTQGYMDTARRFFPNPANPPAPQQPSTPENLLTARYQWDIGCDDCFVAVPAPGSVALLALGGMVAVRRRRA